MVTWALIIFNVFFFICSESNFDVVSCDCCNISVHEGCYGVNDTQSVHSTDSLGSTEPWFCDSCKAGVTNQVSCTNSKNNTGGIIIIYQN